MSTNVATAPLYVAPSTALMGVGSRRDPCVIERDRRTDGNRAAAVIPDRHLNGPRVLFGIRMAPGDAKQLAGQAERALGCRRAVAPINPGGVIGEGFRPSQVNEISQGEVIDGKAFGPNGVDEADGTCRESRIGDVGGAMGDGRAAAEVMARIDIGDGNGDGVLALLTVGVQASDHELIADLGDGAGGSLAVAPVDGRREVAHVAQEVGVGESRDRAGEERALDGRNGQRRGRQLLVGDDPSQRHAVGGIVDAKRQAADVENGVVGVKGEGPAQAAGAAEDRELVAKRRHEAARDIKCLEPVQRHGARHVELIITGRAVELDHKRGGGLKRRLAALQNAGIVVAGAHRSLIHHDGSGRARSSEGAILIHDRRAALDGTIDQQCAAIDGRLPGIGINTGQGKRAGTLLGQPAAHAADDPAEGGGRIVVAGAEESGEHAQMPRARQGADVIAPEPQIESSPGGHVHTGVRDRIVRPNFESTGLDVRAMRVRVDTGQGKGARALFEQIADVAINDPAESRIIAIFAGIEVTVPNVYAARPGQRRQPFQAIRHVQSGPSGHDHALCL